MIRLRSLFILFSSLLIGGFLLTSGIAQPLQDPDQSDTVCFTIQRTAEKYLGKPYVWGAVGLKSFDCSGFIWRVMAENGILVKRTTARKLYMSLPRAQKGSSYGSGALVFFDNLKHVGIVKDRESFYHAQVSMGTNLSAFDPYWRHKVCGFRRLPTQS
jgi:cell wall-associated NlpC family hydrolase